MPHRGCQAVSALSREALRSELGSTSNFSNSGQRSIFDRQGWGSNQHRMALVILGNSLPLHYSEQDCSEHLLSTQCSQHGATGLLCVLSPDLHMNSVKATPLPQDLSL